MPDNATDPDHVPGHGNVYALVVVLAGVTMAGVELLHVSAMSDPLGILLEALLPLVGALALAGLGYALWSDRYGYAPAHVPRVVAWVVIGMAALALVFVWLLAHQMIRGEPLHHAHFLLVNNLVVGGLAGLVVGTYDVRSKASQERVERERSKLQFVEHMLRHHILNGMNVILGQAEKLANGEGTSGDEEAVRLIRTHGEEIVDRVEHVRTIGDSYAEDADAGRTDVDLSAMARAAIDRAIERHPAATFERAIEDDVVARADENLSLVVENLLANAIEHHDAGSPTVEVTVTAEGDRAVLRVVDDGPGIHEDQRAAMLEWEAGSGVVGGMGVGLAIVKVLVDRYDGSVDLQESATGGTAAEISLPGPS